MPTSPPPVLKQRLPKNGCDFNGWRVSWADLLFRDQCIRGIIVLNPFIQAGRWSPEAKPLIQPAGGNPTIRPLSDSKA